MLTSFSSWRVNHLKREFNKVAHELAQVTRSTETSRTWIGVDPPRLHNLLLVDGSKCYGPVRVPCFLAFLFGVNFYSV